MSVVTVAFRANRRAKPKPAEPSGDRRYPARVARQLALAHALQRRVDSGEFADYAMLARAVGFTRARVGQLMNLLFLAPEIQGEIAFLQAPPGRQALTERALRSIVAQPLWGEQRALWATIRPLGATTP